MNLLEVLIHTFPALAWVFAFLKDKITETRSRQKNTPAGQILYFRT